MLILMLLFVAVRMSARAAGFGFNILGWLIGGSGRGADPLRAGDHRAGR